MTEIGDAGTIMRTLTKIFRSILASMILSGVLFFPLRAVEASFFSSLFGGDRVLADVNTDFGANSNVDVSANTVTSPQAQVGSNSQNPELSLQVSDSSQVQSDKNSDNISPALTDNTGTALLPVAGPAGVSGGINSPDPSSNQTSVYKVRQ